MKAPAIEKQTESYRKERDERKDYIKRRKLNQRRVKAERDGDKRG